jgi:hypothetical protein
LQAQVVQRVRVLQLVLTPQQRQMHEQQPSHACSGTQHTLQRHSSCSGVVDSKLVWVNNGEAEHEQRRIQLR